MDNWVIVLPSRCYATFRWLGVLTLSIVSSHGLARPPLQGLGPARSCKCSHKCGAALRAFPVALSSPPVLRKLGVRSAPPPHNQGRSLLSLTCPPGAAMLWGT